MRRYILCALSLAVAAGPASAATCEASGPDVVQASGHSYDPGALSPQLVQIRLLDDHPGSSNACEAGKVTIRPRDNMGRIELRAAGSGAVLHARFVRSSAVVAASAAALEIIRPGSRGGRGSGEVMVDFLDIQPGQFVPPGEYRADLELVTDEGTSRPFSVSVRVVPAMRLVGDSVRRLSLGEVSNGGEAHSAFHYATNATIRVNVRSEHQGRMQHQLGGAFGHIPYAAYLSGERLDLASGGSVFVSLRGSRQAEQVTVQVEPQRNAYAGIYSDTLTLEFVAY